MNGGWCRNRAKSDDYVLDFESKWVKVGFCGENVSVAHLVLLVFSQ